MSRIQPKNTHLLSHTTQSCVPHFVFQSTAIADRPKAKPVSKKEGKTVKKHHLAAYHFAMQQQKEALQLKQLVEMNEQLVSQVGALSFTCLKPLVCLYPKKINSLGMGMLLYRFDDSRQIYSPSLRLSQFSSHNVGHPFVYTTEHCQYSTELHFKIFH